MLRSFSRQCGIDRFARQSLSSSALVVKAPDLPEASDYHLKPGHPSPGRPILLRPSITRQGKYRNMNRFAFDYAFRPHLRCRLTLGGLTWPRKPWTFGVRVSRPHYRYLSLHLLFQTLQKTSRFAFYADWNAPLPLSSTASVYDLCPIIIHARSLD